MIHRYCIFSFLKLKVCGNTELKKTQKAMPYFQQYLLTLSFSYFSNSHIMINFFNIIIFVVVEQTLKPEKIEGKRGREWQRMMVKKATDSMDMNFSANSRRWRRTGKLVCWKSMGSQSQTDLAMGLQVCDLGP